MLLANGQKVKFPYLLLRILKHTNFMKYFYVHFLDRRDGCAGTLVQINIPLLKIVKLLKNFLKET